MVRAALLPAVTDEAQWVAGEIGALLALPDGMAPDGKLWPDARLAGVRPSDIAVLCRKRSQFIPLRQALEARRIPCEVVGLGGLLSVPEVQDVVATLRVLHDAAASDALARLLTGPRWRIGPRDLVALGRRARDLAVVSRGDSSQQGGLPAPPSPQAPYPPLSPATGPMAEGAIVSDPSQATEEPESPRGPAGDDPSSSALSGAAPGEEHRPARAPRPQDAAPGQEDRPTAAAPLDPLAEAVTDLTTAAGTASLVEALDDLGDPDGYSPTGYARLSALAAEARRLREQVARPLADLIAEVERTLSLDIEVAARPGGDLAAARADLDAFTDVAVAFAGDQPEPTLGAFLAYLSAAQQEEFGLETGRVGESDTVKLLTVHAAKGLQWPAVFVPGLAAGERSQVFPAPPADPDQVDAQPAADPVPAARRRGGPARTARARRRLAGRVRRGLRGPRPGRGTAACLRRGDQGRVLARLLRLLVGRGDRAARPVGVPHRDPGRVPGRARDWWRDGRTRPPKARTTRCWPRWTRPTGPPPRPAVTTRRSKRPLSWSKRPPPWPMGRGTLIFTARRLAPRRPARGSGEDGLTERERELVAAWELDAGLLLAEREATRERGEGQVEVVLPARLSVSALVTLARDPDELARQVRRPMPQPPARQARRGTAFHQWLEERFGQQRLIDDDDLFADDEPADPDASLLELKARFEAGEWAGRWPRQVEVPFETRIGDRQLRGRIDAIFASPGGGYDVVDWKTGYPPRSQAERDAVAVQLAAYRLAWSALADVPLDQVSAAFYYVRHDRTVRPADLLDAAGLEKLIATVPVAGG